jgi:hypothetical protein
MKIKTSCEMEYTRRVEFEKEGKDYTALFFCSKNCYEWQVWHGDKNLSIDEIATLLNSNEDELGELMMDIDTQGWEYELSQHIEGESK